MFEYTRQPPSTTLSSCNPYHFDGHIFIVIDCIVRYQTNEFEIRWFRENTTGAVEDLGLGYYEFQENMQLCSRLYYFNNQQYNPSYLGKYWCQVINTTADPDQPLMRSNVFTLLAPENYTQPTCVSLDIVTQRVKNVTCADLPVHSEQTAPTSSDVIPYVTVVAVCAVVLLLIVCSSLIVILIVIHQRRRRKKNPQKYFRSKENG